MLGVEAPADQDYATSLLRRYKELQAGHGTVLLIGDNFYPSATLAKEERKGALGVVDYATEVQDVERYRDVAFQTVLVLHPLDAGLGSSVSRRTYLERIWSEIGRVGEPRLGAKGTDLHITVSLPVVNFLGEPEERVALVSITELKTNRVLVEAKNYAGVVLRPVVNSDSLPFVRGFLASTYIGDRLDEREDTEKRSYLTMLSEDPQTAIGEFIVQGDLPTIDMETGELTNDRRAPGGHGAIGYIVLQEIAQSLPDMEAFPTVRVIYNGDGPNNFPTPEMVGFAVSEHAGVVIVTTTKLGIDLKGGLLGVETIDVNGEKRRVAQVCEFAQAKKAGQEDIFYGMGLVTEDLPKVLQAQHVPGEQYFNTNVVLLNEDTLRPLLKGLKEILGEDGFHDAISPDLIDIPKQQNGKDYMQLEGALASAVLRLARVVAINPQAQAKWDRISGSKPFLRMINLDPVHRDIAFTPNKFASDVLLQTETDQYGLDTKKWQLINTTPGHLPRFGDEWVQDPFYMDVENVLATLGGIQVRQLDSLDIEGVLEPDPNDLTKTKKRGGRIAMKGAILKGAIRIISEYDGVFDLNSEVARVQLGQEGDSNLVLENVQILIDRDGNVDFSPLDSTAH